MIRAQSPGHDRQSQDADAGCGARDSDVERRNKVSGGQMPTASAPLETFERKVAHLSPADALPDDVWFEILDLAYVHRFPECHTDHYAMDDFPIPFSHVSQRFRGLVLTMPKLWACIHITSAQLSPSRDICTMIETQLSRSGDSPLTILLSFHETAQDLSEYDWFEDYTTESPPRTRLGRFHACWEMLRSHSHRWRRLAIYLQLQIITFELLEDGTLVDHLPSLEHFEVYGAPENHSSAESIASYTALIDAPRLRTLRLSGFSRLIPGNSSHLPQPSELFLAKSAEVITWRKLSGCITPIAAALRTLILYKLRFESSSSPIELPQLRHLSFHDISHGEPLINALLQGAPQLLRFELMGYVTNIEALFAGMGAHTFPTVEEFVMWDVHNQYIAANPERYPHDYPFLEPFTGLRHLVFMENHQGVVYRQLRELLRRTQEAQSLYAPTLKELTVGFELSEPFGSIWAQVSIQILREFAKLRSDAGCPLEGLHLAGEFDSELLAETVELKNLVDVVDKSSMVTYRRSFGRWDADRGTPYVPQWKRESA